LSSFKHLIYRHEQLHDSRTITNKLHFEGKRESFEELVVENIVEDQPKIGESKKPIEKPSLMVQKEVSQEKKEPVQMKQEVTRIEKIEPIKKFEMPEESPKKLEETKKKPEKQSKPMNFMDDLDSSFDESKQSDDRY
jgi:hypothetical protein